MNPAILFKLNQAKKTFDHNHPKFGAFIKAVWQSALEEGTVIEIKVTRPDGVTLDSNLKVQASDMEILHDLSQNMGNNV